MATLKISDLSVGDWVSFDTAYLTVDGDDIATAFVKNGQQPVRIKSILADQDLIFAEVETEDDFGTIYLKMEHIRPIPITVEILEKNGFVDKGSCLFPYEREWRGDKSAVNICSFDEELWFADFEFRGGPTGMSDIPLIYINQLQHVFRLAGVEKEINL